MKIKEKKLKVKSDIRGWLAEILTPKDVGNKAFGLIVVTTAKPGQTKGRHYHKRKTEWYCVIKGDGMLTLIDNKTRETKKIEMGEKNMIMVQIPPNHFHLIENIGKTEMFLLVYVNELFNPKEPDNYYE
ncbi:MAG: cupin domain-containing protein [Candidatus Levyibacteriota bacterium]